MLWKKKNLSGPSTAVCVVDWTSMKQYVLMDVDITTAYMVVMGAVKEEITRGEMYRQTRLNDMTPFKYDNICSLCFRFGKCRLDGKKYVCMMCSAPKHGNFFEDMLKGTIFGGNENEEM